MIIIISKSLPRPPHVVQVERISASLFSPPTTPSSHAHSSTTAPTSNLVTPAGYSVPVGASRGYCGVVGGVVRGVVFLLFLLLLCLLLFLALAAFHDRLHSCPGACPLSPNGPLLSFLNPLITTTHCRHI